MAETLLATNRFPGDGVTTQFLITFAGGFIERSHVRAFIEDNATRARLSEITITPGMWIDDANIDLGVAAAIGQNVLILRDTPKDGPLVDFTNRSRITEANLDKIAKQAVFSAAETADATQAEAINQVFESAGIALTAADEAAASAAAAAATATLINAQTAINANNAAQAAKTAAELAETNAETAAATATTQAGIATSVAASASGSATTATTQADIATTQAGNAAASASAAAASVDATRDVPSGTIVGGTLALANRGQVIPISAGVTVPASLFSAGNTVGLYNDTAGNLTITQGSGLTLRNSGTALTGNRTLGQRALCTIWFRSPTEAVITGCS